MLFWDLVCVSAGTFLLDGDALQMLIGNQEERRLTHLSHTFIIDVDITMCVMMIKEKKKSYGSCRCAKIGELL